jgi:hypothetical protein
VRRNKKVTGERELGLKKMPADDISVSLRAFLPRPAAPLARRTPIRRAIFF